MATTKYVLRADVFLNLFVGSADAQILFYRSGYTHEMQ